MSHEKVFGPGRIDCDGSPTLIPVAVRPGGKSAKRPQYMVVIHQKANANTRIGLSLDHGPDGKHFRPHSQPIAYTDPGATPSVLEGTASDATSMIGEYRHICVCIQDVLAAPGNPQWAVVSVWETLKPF